MSGEFRQIQRRFAAHLRNPDGAPAPAGIEPRRLAIYRELIYNNVESFLANGFPVLRAISPDDHWHGMVGDFLRVHRCESPYFLDIGREFLAYLDGERGDVAADPPFLRELAHYEWVELELDIASAEVAEPGEFDPLTTRLRLSPLARNLVYRYPVHRIGPAYQPPSAPPTPTCLLVHRDWSDRVRFMEVNAPTARLVELLDGGERSGGQALAALAAELGEPPGASLATFGTTLLADLVARAILLPA